MQQQFTDIKFYISNVKTSWLFLIIFSYFWICVTTKYVLYLILCVEKREREIYKGIAFIWFRVASHINCETSSCTCQAAASHGFLLHYRLGFKASPPPFFSYPLPPSRALTFYSTNALSQPFLLRSPFPVTWCHMMSSTLLSVFPSPYINPSEGRVGQASDRKSKARPQTRPYGMGTWECVLRFRRMRAFPSGTFSDPWCTLITPSHGSSTGSAEQWWGFSFNCTFE